ncbi:FAD binding domain containing protein [Neofusicoccum parvum]|uniref:FAD binding domain containing protein n=1 Tax=Neofusicoccum parvum TaxID=310453 RepID=A0ACB5RNN9_9PEZI|nr:FAD binding domain containing protein [Neofusicoccum parvum]
MPIQNIIISGAGPSGLLLALLLAQHPSASPIDITLFDAGHGLDPRPRAAYYGPAAVAVLARAGSLLADIRARGFDPTWMTWKRLWDEGRHARVGEGAELLGRIDLDSGADRTACLALDGLGRLLVEHLERVGRERGNVKIRWGARVTGVGEEGGKAWADVEFDGEGEGMGEEKGRKERFSADYVVGCDGASSAVRRQLFGEKGFPGRTWDEQIVAANVYYDFTKWGYTDIQFFIHPEHWHMVARLAGPPTEYWRVSYGERSGLTHEELLERQPAKFAAMLPGHPQPGDYDLVGFSPYRVHQRLAPSMRVGKIMLAADAAHLCNPFGGLGLTGGIVDVGGLYDCLAGIHDGRADESILDVYSDVRRAKWTDIIDVVSSENIRRLFGQDPERAAETDEFIKLINVAEKDEKVRDEMRASLHAIQYDFKQHYRDAGSSSAAGNGAVKGGVGEVAGGGVGVVAASN